MSVVVITGGGSGIGRALAEGFARDGDEVVVFGRHEESLAGTAVACGGRAMMVQGDVTCEEDVDRLVAISLKRFGRIDVLFNNAGIGDHWSLLDRPFSAWAQVIKVNLLGPALCTHRVLPTMLERGRGRIINMVSRHAEGIQPNLSAYAASKAALISFTKRVAKGIDRDRHPNLLVNAMIPGLTLTPIFAPLPPEELARLAKVAQEPSAVYPHARFIVDLPSGGPTGRVFFNSQDYAVYQHFND